MIILGIVLLIIFLIAIVATIFITTYTFYHPAKSRVIPKVISDFDREYYEQNTDELVRAMNEMDETETETVSVKSDDGYSLVGHLFIRDESSPFILFAHGYHGTYMRDGYGSYRFSQNAKLNILMIEQRSHGNSESDFVTFGVKEREDIKTWIMYLNSRFNSPDIVLSGVSMGAATVMMAAGLNLPSNIKGIIEDCGYTSPKEIIINTAKNMNVPGAMLYPLARLGALIVAKADMNSCRAIDCVKNTSIPMMFIHSKMDGFVPFEMSDRLYEACKAKKKRLIIKDAKHAVNALFYYNDYEEAVFDFLREIEII